MHNRIAIYESENLRRSTSPLLPGVDAPSAITVHGTVRHLVRVIDTAEIARIDATEARRREFAVRRAS